ncbi:MAG: hypothetical protein SFW36_12575 [Leptolyngbyaceae cyanobacterium bins.59]|nr:hypothetical protein [Leptolyngbyaceae cyanobacterium bins.59]
MQLPVRSVLMGLLAVPVVISPLLAHNIQRSGEVAATFHIEPNHRPIAGKPSLTWLALTRRGGRLIPLTDCDCRLSVYAVPRAATAKPILQAPLRAINRERYQGIPAADITFPKPGRYEVELVGRHQLGTPFRPFRFTYLVIVR